MTALGTWLFTWARGEKIGVDAFGNRYYRERGGAASGRRRRRWVIYKGRAEPSKVPAGWHAWLHYSADEPPAEAAAGTRPWQKPHLPNLTGTVHAYRPPGDMAGEARQMPEPYQPWRP